MKLLPFAIVAFVFTLFSFTTLDLASVDVDLDKSTVAWKASKVTGHHNGTLKLSMGELNFTDGQLSGGSFTIDMTSVQCTDLEGGSKGKLEGHLKSADFFGVETFPTASFVIKNVVARGAAGDYKVIGDVTIKGIKKEIKFNTMLADDTATANIVLDRSDFNVRYGSGSFFSNLGDKTIHDEFELDIALVYSK